MELCKMLKEGVKDFEDTLDSMLPPEKVKSAKDSVISSTKVYKPGTPEDVTLAKTIRSCKFSNKPVAVNELMDILRKHELARK